MACKKSRRIKTVLFSRGKTNEIPNCSKLILLRGKLDLEINLRDLKVNKPPV